MRDGLATEWLLTNGLGGFAMGTVLGANTRRYHGLLVAARTPPTGRVLAVHSTIEQLQIGQRWLDLSTHQFGDDLQLHPDGHRYLVDFDPLQSRGARWTLRLGSVTITRTLTVHEGENSATLEYEASGLDAPARLRVRPLTPLRGFHDLDGEGDAGFEIARVESDRVGVRRGEVELRMRAAGGTWTIEPQWWRDFAYEQERQRGQDWREDVWSPGTCTAAWSGGRGGTARLTLHFLVPEPTASGAPAPAVGEGWFTPEQRLHHAARQFVVRRDGAAGTAAGRTIIAGYPWFADWGRDAMISVPGLLLATGRLDEAEAVLTTFAGHMRGGLLPNCFHDVDDPLDNSVDASLWFVHAVHALARGGGATPPRLLDACHEVIDAYARGTGHGIAVDGDDGLLCAGDGLRPITWMDAARGGQTFTPRDGKAVEINALWHHALCCLIELDPGGRRGAALRRHAARCAESMRTRFWWSRRECLHDVLRPVAGGWEGDERLRPNQIFAVSLEHSPLSRAQQEAVVTAVEKHLLTPYGLRTLEPDDPGYRGRFEGDLMQRDAAYHNGTVWPWLIGPFAEAVLRVGGFDDASRARVRRLLEPLLGELDRGCLNQLAEVYDGDEPHRASGCVAQAWSVAEVLRVLALI